ncbi:MAG: DUF1972 domain-containing protein [Bacteroidia bacterium]|nr:DUF1972 domain-containing protein [Bacteroidia bacterium]
MKIAIVGTKGIPATYGGFETFAFHLAKHLSGASHEITVVNENGNYAINFDFPVQIAFSKYNKSKNPLLFYWQSIKLVCKSHDIVLICGVGGAAFYPFYRKDAILITNVDGLEHLRKKYTFLQRKLVFVLQKFAAMFSDHLVADSFEVEKYWGKRFPKNINRISSIAYGAEVPVKFNDSILTELGIAANDYYLVVARIVPENNLLLILEAFKLYKGRKKLIVVGNANDNQFALSISISTDDRLRFIGSLYEKDKLDSLRVNCFAYIHGHSVGGTNPALLEAMVCKSVCLCHDNVFNREVTGSNQEYFKSASELVTLMEELEKDESRKLDLSNKAFNRVVENYSWEKIAMQYEDLFSQILLNQRR